MLFCSFDHYFYQRHEGPPCHKLKLCFGAIPNWISCLREACGVMFIVLKALPLALRRAYNLSSVTLICLPGNTFKKQQSRSNFQYNHTTWELTCTTQSLCCAHQLVIRLHHHLDPIVTTSWSLLSATCETFYRIKQDMQYILSVPVPTVQYWSLGKLLAAWLHQPNLDWEGGEVEIYIKDVQIWRDKGVCIG